MLIIIKDSFVQHKTALLMYIRRMQVFRCRPSSDRRHEYIPLHLNSSFRAQCDCRTISESLFVYDVFLCFFADSLYLYVARRMASSLYTEVHPVDKVDE